MLNMLTKNDVFGEIALLEHTRRTATAKAFEPSLLLSITREKFDKLSEVFPEFCETMQPLCAHRTANTLKTVSVFKKLTAEKRETLGGLLEFKTYSMGDTIAKEHDFDATMFILVHGSVQCTCIDEVTGSTILLSVIEEGSVMGEMAMLAGTKRTASLIALESCLCLCLGADKFRRFLPLAPEILDDLVDVAQRRRRTSVSHNAERAITIPAIGEDTKNKLHLYSLMRPEEDDNHDLTGENDESDVSNSNVSERNTISNVKELQDGNEEIRIEITQKKHQIKELRERIIQLGRDIEKEGEERDFHDKLMETVQTIFKRKHDDASLEAIVKLEKEREDQHEQVMRARMQR